MTRRKRSHRRLAIDFECLVKADNGIAQADALWLGQGYTRSNARLWRRQDGTYTARIVWRNRAAIASAIVYTLEGLRL